MEPHIGQMASGSVGITSFERFQINGIWQKIANLPNNINERKVDVEMKKDNKKENKYFEVYNETTANVLKGATGQRYYKFKTESGITAYSFVNDEKFKVAKRTLEILSSVDFSEISLKSL